MDETIVFVKFHWFCINVKNSKIKRERNYLFTTISKTYIVMSIVKNL